MKTKFRILLQYLIRFMLKIIFVDAAKSCAYDCPTLWCRLFQLPEDETSLSCSTGPSGRMQHNKKEEDIDK